MPAPIPVRSRSTERGRRVGESHQILEEDQMSTQTQARAPMAPQTPDNREVATARVPTVPMNTRIAEFQQPGMLANMPRGTETKPAVKSTEFYIYLAAVAGVLIASQLTGRNSTGVDIFRADNAWFMITLLTIAYLVSRGLSKAGSSWRQAREREH
jgi:hypothetical protein